MGDGLRVLLILGLGVFLSFWWHSAKEPDADLTGILLVGGVIALFLGLIGAWLFQGSS